MKPRPICQQCRYIDETIDSVTCNLDAPSEDFPQPEVRPGQVACGAFEEWPVRCECGN